MNNRITKWTWDKFGAPEPDFDWRSIATRNELPELIEDPDAIRSLVDFPDAERIDVRFYPTVGLAILVVTGCDAILTLDDLRKLNKSSSWDVMVVTSREFRSSVEAAERKFTAVEGLPASLPKSLVENGVMDFNDLSIVDPDWLASLDGMTVDTAEKLIEYAELNGEP